MHTHLSLFEGDTNAFHEPGAPYQLSKTARQFIAGLLHHGAEITAVTNQWVNSYKRLWGGGEAPAHLTWGHNNRSAHGPRADVQAEQGQQQPGRGAQHRHGVQPLPRLRRAPRRGLKGIEEGYDLPPETEDDVWSLTDAERKAMGIKPLPASLNEAIAVMESSELVAETLGEHTFEFFLRNKRAEWEDYRNQVTAFELERYLPAPLTGGRRERPRPRIDPRRHRAARVRRPGPRQRAARRPGASPTSSARASTSRSDGLAAALAEVPDPDGALLGLVRFMESAGRDRRCAPGHRGARPPPGRPGTGCSPCSAARPPWATTCARTPSTGRRSPKLVR